jgi:preprotein translocase subunit SecD
MLHFSTWKQVAIILTCLLGVLLVIPNFVSKETLATWPRWVPKTQLTLGLDLRGGAHLLLAMEVADVRKDWLNTLRDDARKRLREAKIPVTAVGITNNAVQVRLVKPEDTDAAFKSLSGLIQQTGNLILGTTVTDLEVTKADGGVIRIAPTEAGLQHRISSAISAAIETVRRRVDAMGTTEPNIVRQGSARILVQVPGLQDTAQLKELIGKTARLSFHEVHPAMSAEEGRQRPPTGYKVYESDDREEGAQLLNETPVVRGDDLVDAQPGFDQRTNEPIISFRSTHGRAQVRQLHQGHVNRPFAILLDDKVISPRSSASRSLAALARSAAASPSRPPTSCPSSCVPARPPSSLIVEERTVGPSLGADSIEAGTRAGIIGASPPSS